MSYYPLSLKMCIPSTAGERRAAPKTVAQELEQVITNRNQSDPWLQSTCQVSLGEILTLTLLSDALIRVWMLHRKHLSMEKHSCMNNACCIEHSHCSGRVEEFYIRTSSLNEESVSCLCRTFLQFYFMFLCVEPNSGIERDSLNKHMDDKGLYQIPHGKWMSVYVNVHIRVFIYAYMCSYIYIYVYMSQSVYINIIF